MGCEEPGLGVNNRVVGDGSRVTGHSTHDPAVHPQTRLPNTLYSPCVASSKTPTSRFFMT